MINNELLTLVFAVDRCADNVCNVNAQCIPNRSGYECLCNFGFTGDGFNCQGKFQHDTVAATKDCSYLKGRSHLSTNKPYAGRWFVPTQRFHFQQKNVKL